ncbi:MAG TPA: peptide ABC transporter permease [Solibacterales bacterium]|nr:peptide ABC transporter permease [Bryobacterales bacterium]
MTAARRAACGYLAMLLVAAAAGPLVLPGYEVQFREDVLAGPSARFPLGTDEFGRDRLSRLLHGARVSLALAPAAALLTAGIGGLAGILAAAGGWTERVVLGAADLLLCVPWLFLLLIIRAALPLNLDAGTSLAVTFLLLGLLGWAGPARVTRAEVRRLAQSDFIRQARASGYSRHRLLLAQLLPAVRPVLAAQFWIAVPAFLLAEANLGLLGLGVSPPLPSLGSLLKELENYGAVREHPAMLAPVLLLATAVAAWQSAVRKERLS